MKLLIVDDDPGISYMLQRIAQDEGHDVVNVATLAEGLRHVREQGFDCVFLDVFLPDGNGLDALPTIRQLDSPPEVIILTGKGDPEGAELAIKNGAWSYLEKSSTVEQITLVIDQVVKYRRRQKEAAPRVLKRGGIIGSSPSMNAALEAVAQAATSKASVLITGETGVGKELIARAIHKNSSRAGKAFMVVDCAALPPNLVESTLFGHVRGAFTGADAPKDGLIKLADGGTLFLDEIGELPLEMQRIFLRVLQEKTFRPVGSQSEARSDFRLIAATNRSLEQMSEAGNFRPDLLFRLKSFVIDLPPLRERKGDIRALIRWRLEILCDSYGAPVKGVSPEAMRVFEQFDWPGNVRELFQCLERSLIASGDSPVVYPEHLPLELRAIAARMSIQRRPETSPDQGPAVVRQSVGSQSELPFKVFRKAAVAAAEKEYLQRLMEVSGGSIKNACRIAELSRTRLYNLMKEHGVSKDGGLKDSRP